MSGRGNGVRPRHDWWVWVSAGVAWGLLCVGVRHLSLGAGVEIERLVAQRSEALGAVQALERRVAQAGQLENLERAATAAGFVTPPPGRVVIAPPVEHRGWLARWFGAGETRAAVNGTPGDEPALPIRPREEVTTAPRRLTGKVAAATRNKAARARRDRAAHKPA